MPFPRNKIVLFLQGFSGCALRLCTNFVRHFLFGPIVVRGVRQNESGRCTVDNQSIVRSIVQRQFYKESYKESDEVPH